MMRQRFCSELALALWLMLLGAVWAAPPQSSLVRFVPEQNAAPVAADGEAAVGQELPLDEAGDGHFLYDTDDDNLSFDKPQSVESFLEAVPPPDPRAAQWGSLERPLRGPPRMPTYNYQQAGPPLRVIQFAEPQIYERPVDDPDRLMFDDGDMNTPINLYRPDGIAPPGIIGDHTLKAGHALFSYRYGVVGYQGSYTGTHLATAGQVSQQFNNVPTTMYRQQHTLLLEYAPTDDLTALLVLPIQVNSINYLTDKGSTIHDAYTQLGDISLWALYTLKRWKHQQIHANLGMSIPTNLLQTLNEFSTPGSVHLSYPMRVGSGSYELLPGVTYRGQTEKWTWGFQSIVTIPLGYNRYSYELGNQIDLNAWAWRRLSERFAASGRLHGSGWGNIRGQDRNLTPSLVETNAPNLQGGTRLDLLFGGQYYWPWLRVPGNWFSIEAGFPIYQNLHGPQPRATWLLNGGWNMMW